MVLVLPTGQRFTHIRLEEMTWEMLVLRSRLRMGYVLTHNTLAQEPLLASLSR